MPTEIVDLLTSPGPPAGAPVLHLFNGPAVSCSGEQRLPVPEGSQRLLVFVALHPNRVDRRYIAGALWPIGDDERAAGNLRSALWRMNRARVNVLAVDKRSVQLRRDVVTDLNLISDWAGRLIHGTATPEDLRVMPAGMDALELLPGWYDDWVLLERERLRQRLLHGLEALSRSHRLAGRYAMAVEAAMVAVNADPLRESAQRELLTSHLMEGNWCEARRSYDTYRVLLRREIGVDPQPELEHLLSTAIST